MIKTPVLGLASILLLIAIAGAVIVFFAIDEPIPTDSYHASPIVGFEGIGELILFAIATLGAIFVSFLLAVFSLIRKERRFPAIISLAVSMPIFLYLLAVLFWP